MQVKPKVSIGLRGEPDHSSAPTNVKLRARQMFEVCETRQVVREDGGNQVFLRLADGSGWAFMYNRHTEEPVVEEVENPEVTGAEIERSRAVLVAQKTMKRAAAAGEQAEAALAAAKAEKENAELAALKAQKDLYKLMES